MNTPPPAPAGSTEAQDTALLREACRSLRALVREAAQRVRSSADRFTVRAPNRFGGGNGERFQGSRY